MNLNKILVLFSCIALLSISNFNAYGQENIATARPTSAIGAWTIPTNSFQFEQGFTVIEDTLVLDGMFRLAVSKIGEIRVVTLYGSDKIVFGGKVMFLDPARHNTGLALKLSIDNNFRVLDFRMIATQKLNDTFSIFGNVGVIPGGKWYGIALFNIGLGEKFSTYLEGVFEGDYQQFNTGLTYLINSETQVDINTGILNNSSMYVGVGFARRIKFDNLIH